MISSISAARLPRSGAHKVTKREAAANPAERGRAGLTRLHKIGAQGVHTPFDLPGGTFTTVGAAPRKKKARRKKR